MSTLQDAEGKLVVVRHVELVESDPVAVCFSNVFDWIAACCGETVWNVELFRYFSNGKLANGIIDLVNANGVRSQLDRKSYGRRL